MVYERIKTKLVGLRCENYSRVLFHKYAVQCIWPQFIQWKHWETCILSQMITRLRVAQTVYNIHIFVGCRNII